MSVLLTARTSFLYQEERAGLKRVWKSAVIVKKSMEECRKKWEELEESVAQILIPNKWINKHIYTLNTKICNVD